MSRADWSISRWFAFVLIGVLIAAGVAMAAPADQTLVVERIHTGESVIQTSVEQGTLVALEYTHSVEKTRVYDAYRVNGTALENTRMEFESYGWGLPATATVTREDGVFVYDPSGQYEQLQVAPGRIADHTLIVGETRYDLVERTNGTSVRIRVRNTTLPVRLLGDL